MAVTVDLSPEVVDFKLFGTDAWSVNFSIPDLGTLVGATVTAMFLERGQTVPVSLTVVILDAAACVFSIGAAVPKPGKYDIAITLSGGLPRTYVRGQLKVQADPV